MAYALKLERFEGPLDLLLQLVEKEELPIAEVSLASVTEQYLQYLETQTDLAPEELADFLVVAAKLLLLKSRVLLPNLFVDEEEGTESLTRQLELYRHYVEASRQMAKRLAARSFSYAHERLPIAETATFSPPSDLKADALYASFARLVADLARYVRPAPEVIHRTVSLQEKIGVLRKLLTGTTEVSFHQMLSEAKNRMEIIVSFLAVLELVKQRTVVARQDGHGESILLASVVLEESNPITL